MKLFLQSALFAALFFVFYGEAIALEPSVYVSPTNINLVEGEEVSLEIKLSPNTNEIFAVEGEMVFEGLTCKKIKPNQDLVVQTMPNCQSGYFLVGIPGGTTNDSALFSVLVEPESGNEASLLLRQVDLIGMGISLSRIGIGGTYSVIESYTPSATLSSTATDTLSAEENTPEEIGGSTFEEEGTSGNFAAFVSEVSADGGALPWIIIIVCIILVMVIGLRKLMKK